MRTHFRDRTEAGELLAGKLTHYANEPDVIVLALPRGGVPVGAQVAKKLGVPLDVFVVRKLGLPGHPELAMGAIASGGVRVFNGDVVERLSHSRRSHQCRHGGGVRRNWSGASDRIATISRRRRSRAKR